MKKYTSLILWIVFLALSACGGSTSPQTNNKNAPLMVIKNGELNQVSDQLSGSLTIYDTAGKVLKKITLSFSEDADGNTVVTSPVFDLEKSTTYRFVIVFLWNGTPITYVDTTQATANDASTVISFSEDMLVYAQDATDANISANITSGLIPDLDSDDDGYSNFDEIRSGSDANDATSTPQGPTISNLNAQLSEEGSLLTITADVSDKNGINDISCDYTGASYLSAIATLTVTGTPSDISRKIRIELNPLNAREGDLNIVITATNGKNRSSSAQTQVMIPASDSNIGPVVIIENLAENQIVGGIVNISVKAFDRSGVQSITLSSPSGINNTSSASDRFVGDWDTNQLADGKYKITIVATDTQGVSTPKTINVNVSNGADLTGPKMTITANVVNDSNQFFDIKNGEEVFGKIDFQVLATDPNVPSSLIFLNANNVSGLGSNPTSTSNLYRNTLDTTQSEEGANIALVFQATDNLGNVTPTSFNLTVHHKPSIYFTVNNLPTVSIPQAGNVTFDWKTTKTNRVTIKHLSTGTVMMDSAQNTGSTQFPIIYSGIYRLTATRIVNSVTYINTQDVSVLINNFNLRDADLIFMGEDAGDTAGFSMENGGDINGDGWTDLLIGASEHADHKGAVYLIYGKNGLNGTHNLSEVASGLGAKIIGTSAGNRNGTRVFNVGDMNDDGRMDFVIGNYAENASVGAAYLFHGNTKSNLNGNLTLSQAYTQFLGYNDGSTKDLGIAVAGGRFAGSASRDLIFGVPNPGYGRAYLFNGPIQAGIRNLSQANTLIDQNERTQPNAFGYLGYSVANGGDLNQDNLDELLIGSFNGDSGGRVYLSYGSANSLPAVVNASNISTTFTGENNWAENGANDTLGVFVSAAGDVNGDGIEDVIMYAGQYDNSRGAVYLFYGPVTGHFSAADADAKFIGEEIGDSFGNFLTHGDVNRDGYSDLFLGAPRNDSNGLDSGAVYIFYGKPVNQELAGTYLASQSDVKFVGDNAGDEIYVSKFLRNFSGIGNNDIAIASRAANNQSGAIYIFHGIPDL